MNLTDAVVVGAAGAIGAGSRFALDAAIRARARTTFPVGTLAVNLSGSLVLGFLAGLVLFHAASSRLTLIGGTGFCGGYTTFSTASYETVRLGADGEGGAAVLNAGASALGTLGAAALGLTLAYFT